jgi:hypothetical protein
MRSSTRYSGSLYVKIAYTRTNTQDFYIFKIHAKIGLHSHIPLQVCSYENSSDSSSRNPHQPFDRRLDLVAAFIRGMQSPSFTSMGYILFLWVVIILTITLSLATPVSAHPVRAMTTISQISMQEYSANYISTFELPHVWTTLLSNRSLSQTKRNLTLSDRSPSRFRLRRPHP